MAHKSWRLWRLFRNGFMALCVINLFLWGKYRSGLIYGLQLLDTLHFGTIFLHLYIFMFCFLFFSFVAFAGVHSFLRTFYHFCYHSKFSIVSHFVSPTFIISYSLWYICSWLRVVFSLTLYISVLILCESCLSKLIASTFPSCLHSLLLRLSNCFDL